MPTASSSGSGHHVTSGSSGDSPLGTIDHYNFYRADYPEGPFVFKGTSTTLTYNDTTQRPNHAYFYRATAVYTDNSESAPYDTFGISTFPAVTSVPVNNRPCYMVQFHNGNPNDTASGLNDRWRWGGTNPPTDAEAVQWLIDSMEEAYAVGYRDFIFHMIGGSLTTDGWFTSSQWFVIPASRRTEMINVLAPYIAAKKEQHPEYTVTEYRGIPIRNDRVMTNNELANGIMHLPDTNVTADLRWLELNDFPWLNIGVNRIMLDAAAATYTDSQFGGRSLNDGALVLQTYLQSKGFEVAGEAIPVDSATDYDFDPNYLYQMPWMCTSQFFEIYDRIVTNFTGATYTASSHVITKAGYFSGYTFQTGDLLQIGFNSAFPFGVYRILQKIDNDSVQISLEVNTGATIPTTDVSGILGFGIIRPGYRTSRWYNPSPETQELGVVQFYGSGWDSDTFTDLLNRGFRLYTLAGDKMEEIMAAYLATLPNPVLSSIYSTISNCYGNARSYLLEANGLLFDAIYQIVLVNELLPEIDLMSTFYSTYQIISTEFASPKLFIPAVRTLNAHVLKTSGYDTVDDYLYFNAITVSPSWQLLSDTAGYPIGDEHLA